MKLSLLPQNLFPEVHQNLVFGENSPGFSEAADIMMASALFSSYVLGLAALLLGTRSIVSMLGGRPADLPVPSFPKPEAVISFPAENAGRLDLAQALQDCNAFEMLSFGIPSTWVFAKTGVLLEPSSVPSLPDVCAVAAENWKTLTMSDLGTNVPDLGRILNSECPSQSPKVHSPEMFVSTGSPEIAAAASSDLLTSYCFFDHRNTGIGPGRVCVPDIDETAIMNYCVHIHQGEGAEPSTLDTNFVGEMHEMLSYQIVHER